MIVSTEAGRPLYNLPTSATSIQEFMGHMAVFAVIPSPARTANCPSAVALPWLPHGEYQKRFRSLLFEPSNNPRDNKKQIAYATGTDSYSDSVAGLDTPGGPKRQKLFTHGTWNVAYGNYLW